MFQDDRLTTDQKERYHASYGKMADAVDASVQSYLWALGHVNEHLKAIGKDTHVALALLLMDYADPIDGVSVLARKGSAKNCTQLIRTGFELQLGLLYMMQREDKFEERCLAYEFFHWMKQLKVAIKCDPASDSGKQVRARIKGELLADAFDHPDRDIAAEIAGLRKMVENPRYAAVKAEYDRSEPKQWYGMWCGPKTIEQLAAALDRLGHYEVMYRYWSSHSHGESALKRLVDDGKELQMDCVRSPKGLPMGCLHACNLANEMTTFLVLNFVPAIRPEAAARYLSRIKPGLEFLSSVKGLEG